MSPWLFTPPRQVVAVTLKSGDSFDVEQGTYWAIGEGWVSWRTKDGETYATPAHHVASLAYDPPLESGFGFA